MVKYHYVVLTCPKRWYLWVLCYQTQMGSSYCLLVCMWVDRYTIGSKTTRTQKKWSNHIDQEQPKEFTQWFASKAWENGVALKWRHFIAKSQCPNSKKKLLKRVQSSSLQWVQIGIYIKSISSVYWTTSFLNPYLDVNILLSCVSV